MKLLLCSEGFNTEELVKKCEELVGKPREDINIAVINEAYAVEHDNNLRWVVNNLSLVEKNFGGKLELVNLLALSLENVKKRIELHDVIFVVGGHTDYLMSVFNKTGFSKLLPKLLNSKVYVGSSAGSMVMGERLSSKAYKIIYGERGDYGVSKYLELVNLSIIPHLDSSKHPERKEMLTELAKKHEGKIYGLCDDSAVVVDNNKLSTIGSPPVVFNN